MPWLIQDRLFQIEFAFNYWNIGAYSLKKWIYCCEIIMLRNKSVNYFEFCPTSDKDGLDFQKCMLAHRRLDKSQWVVYKSDQVAATGVVVSKTFVWTIRLRVAPVVATSHRLLVEIEPVQLLRLIGWLHTTSNSRVWMENWLEIF